MTEPTPAVPRVAFLGVCERAALVREGHPATWRQNFIGLRQTIFNFFYPCSFVGWHIVLACYEAHTMGEARVRLVDESGEQLFNLDIRIEERPRDQGFESAVEERGWLVMMPIGPRWLLLHHPLEGAVVQKPGPIGVMLRTAGSSEEVRIGTVYCALSEPEPLTPERIAAIRSDPRASKYVRVVLGCKKCPSKLFVTAGIDRPADLDGVTKVWYQDAPDAWRCSCGSTAMQLHSIKRNLHGAVGTPVPKGGDEAEISFIRMYERGTLADLCAGFGALLDSNPPEETVQAFFDQHPVFLHSFSAAKIKPKAPVLTKHKTDFAVLDSRGMLLLIELEKPGIRLLRKNGDIAKDLQHAFGQARTWLHTVNRRWTAALDCMGFREDEVVGARAVVIAGRDHVYSAEHLMWLKGSDHGQVEFYTYDDILEATVILARSLE